jgi:hypothetical protein
VLYVHADEAASPAIAASRRATRAMRRLIAAVVNSGAPADELDAAAETLERLADALDRVQARRIHASARILVDGEVTAEAEGVMVAVPERTFHDGAED